MDNSKREPPLVTNTVTDHSVEDGHKPVIPSHQSKSQHEGLKLKISTKLVPDSDITVGPGTCSPKVGCGILSPKGAIDTLSPKGWLCTTSPKSGTMSPKGGIDTLSHKSWHSTSSPKSDTISPKGGLETPSHKRWHSIPSPKSSTLSPKGGFDTLSSKVKTGALSPKRGHSTSSPKGGQGALSPNGGHNTVLSKSKASTRQKSCPSAGDVTGDHHPDKNHYTKTKDKAECLKQVTSPKMSTDYDKMGSHQGSFAAPSMGNRKITPEANNFVYSFLPKAEDVSKKANEQCKQNSFTKCNGDARGQVDSKPIVAKPKHSPKPKERTKNAMQLDTNGLFDNSKTIPLTVQTGENMGATSQISPPTSTSSQSNRTKYVNDSEKPSTSKGSVTKPKRKRGRPPKIPVSLELPPRIVDEPQEQFLRLDVGSNESPDSGIQSVGSPDHESSPRHNVDLFLLPPMSRNEQEPVLQSGRVETPSVNQRDINDCIQSVPHSKTTKETKTVIKKKGSPGRPPKKRHVEVQSSPCAPKRKPGRPKGSLNKKTLLKALSKNSVVEGTLNINLPASLKDLNVKKRSPTRSRKYPVPSHQVAPSICDKDKPKNPVTPMDNELNSIMLSVKASIDSQFSSANTNDLNLDLSPVEKLRKSKMFNCRPASVKSKVKKPKVHVMMRTHKHRKHRKKKMQSAMTIQPSRPVNEPLNIDISFPSDHFGSVKSSSPTKSLHSATKSIFSGPSSFTSLFPSAISPKTFSPKLSGKTTLLPGPDDILLSDSGAENTSETGKTHRDTLASVTSDISESDKVHIRSLSKNVRARKKKKKMLNLKSKHRNIVDPVFIAEMDDLVILISSLSLSTSIMPVSKNPFGEDLIPAVFKINKCIFQKPKKISGISHTAKPSKPKPAKTPSLLSIKTVSPSSTTTPKVSKVAKAKSPKVYHKKHVAPVFTVPQIVGNPPRIIDAPLPVVSETPFFPPPTLVKKKRGRPRKYPVEGTPTTFQSSFTKSAHCLPPKKRHKLLAASSQASESCLQANPSSLPSVKRKIKRLKKGTNPLEGCENDCNLNTDTTESTNFNDLTDSKSATDRPANETKIMPDNTETSKMCTNEQRSLFETFGVYENEIGVPTKDTTSLHKENIQGAGSQAAKSLSGVVCRKEAKTLQASPRTTAKKRSLTKKRAKELKRVNLEEDISPHKLSKFTSLKKPRKNSAGGYEERMKALFQGSSTLVNSGCLNIDHPGNQDPANHRKRFLSAVDITSHVTAVSPKKRSKSEYDDALPLEYSPKDVPVLQQPVESTVVSPPSFTEVPKKRRGRLPGSVKKAVVEKPLQPKRRGRPPGAKNKKPKLNRTLPIHNLVQKIKKRVGRPPKDPFRRQLFYKGINVSKLGIQTDGVSEIFLNNRKYSKTCDRTCLKETLDRPVELHSKNKYLKRDTEQISSAKNNVTVSRKSVQKTLQDCDNLNTIGSKGDDGNLVKSAHQTEEEGDPFMDTINSVVAKYCHKKVYKLKRHRLIGARAINKYVKRPLNSEYQPLPNKRRRNKTKEENKMKDSEVKVGNESSLNLPITTAEKTVYPLPKKRMRRLLRPPKKKYQKVGLFSDYYKQDNPVVNEIKTTPKNKEIMAYKTGDLEHGLLPPPFHVGKYLRETVKDFCLPYDIWWEHMHKKSGKPTSPKYKKIRNNIHVDDKPTCRDELHACTCLRPNTGGEAGCTEECLNRMMYAECSPSTCPCGDSCSNQKIQKREWAEGLEKIVTKDRGYGVHSTTSLRAGQFIVEYVGEVVSEGEFRRRMMEHYSQDHHHYCLSLSSGTVIDGYRMGNICRFVNHSCHPNCEMQKWNVNGVYRIALFALHDIEPSCELTYDYNFHAFNLDSQQICKCGSQDCRGIMGGRTQRLNGMIRDKSTTPKPKRGRKNKNLLKKLRDKKLNDSHNNGKAATLMKPMSHRERCFAQKHKIFLVRNMEKMRRQKNKPSSDDGSDVNSDFVGDSSFTKKDVFMSKFNSLTTVRSIKTRRLTVAEEDGEVTKTAKLAQVFKDIYTAVTSCKDEDGNVLSLPLMNVPPRTRNPDYYEIIKDPIDLNTIERNILSGLYKNVELFDDDILKLFSNVETYCSMNTDMCHLVLRLRKVYQSAKMEASPLFEEILGENWERGNQSEEESRAVCVSSDPGDITCPDTGEAETMELPALVEGEVDIEKDEVIRCACNIYVDEGLMIMCEKCQKWQHADCMGISGDVEGYTCELCSGYKIDPEIVLKPQPHDGLPGCTYYIALMKDDLQIRIGHYIYLLREGDMKRRATSAENGVPSRENLDVFRVERLWKNEKGEKFAFGHHFYRPHETYHEPSRKFFPNEVFRVPLYEIVPFNAIVGMCVVMDLHTYCRGRPKGIKEEDVYICEYRLDKTAHFFAKISRTSFPINTFSYCFDTFERRLTPRRTYTPHIVPRSYKRRGAPLKSAADMDVKSEAKSDADQEEDVPLVKVKEAKMKQKKERLQELLGRLLSRAGVDIALVTESRLTNQTTESKGKEVKCQPS